MEGKTSRQPSGWRRKNQKCSFDSFVRRMLEPTRYMFGGLVRKLLRYGGILFVSWDYKCAAVRRNVSWDEPPVHSQCSTTVRQFSVPPKTGVGRNFTYKTDDTGEKVSGRPRVRIYCRAVPTHEATGGCSELSDKLQLVFIAVHELSFRPLAKVFSCARIIWTKVMTPAYIGSQYTHPVHHKVLVVRDTSIFAIVATQRPRRAVR